MATVGRPKHPFDWDTLDSLLGLEAPLSYCAEILLKKKGSIISATTIQKMEKMIQRNIERRFEMNFVSYRAKKADPINYSLRKKQTDLALSGNATMLIWLGKQRLGQSDQVQTKVDEKSTRTVKYVAMKATGEEVEVKPIVLAEDFKFDQEL